MAVLQFPDFFNDSFAVTPSDANLLEADAANTKGYKFAALRVYSGAAGNTIVVTTTEGTDITLTLGAGVEYIPGKIKQVKATGTTVGLGITALIKK